MILLPLPKRFVEVAAPVSRVSATVEKAIEEIWQAELRRRPSLFNGRAFSVQQIAGDEVSGHFVEYRHFLAQWLRPGLYEHLGIEVLAVTGVLAAPGGVVWGRRGAQSTQNPGAWELIPSGGIDQDAQGKIGTIDLKQQILRELKEEVGIGEDLVQQVQPFCFIHDEEHHLYECGIELQVSLSMDEILAHRSTLKSPEHTDLALVGPSRIEEWIAGQPRPLSDLTRLILSARE